MIQIYKNKHDFCIEEITSLWLSVGWIHGSLDHKDRLLEALKIGTVYSVYDDDHLVGLLEAFDDSFTVFLNYLLVHPDYQKQGIGTQLMEMFEDQFKGYRQVVTTDEAKDFYEKFGFQHSSYGMHQ